MFSNKIVTFVAIYPKQLFIVRCPSFLFSKLVRSLMELSIDQLRKISRNKILLRSTLSQLKSSELNCSYLRHCFLATKGTTSKSASPSSVGTKPTRPPVTIRTKKPLLSSKATVPLTKGKVIKYYLGRR